MDTLVTGTVRTSTGTLPDFFVHAEGDLSLGNVKVRFQGTILGGHVFVAFSGDQSQRLDNTDQVFRFAKHSVENLILGQVLREGVGLQCSLEHCRTSDGKLVKAVPDSAPVSADGPQYDDLTHAMGLDPRLRYAMRDFNSGLIDRESCPVYFYRALETIARIVSGNETGSLTRSDWERFHSVLETTEDMLARLLNCNKAHRHGTHVEFSKDEHLAMMKITREILIRFVGSLSEKPG